MSWPVFHIGMHMVLQKMGDNFLVGDAFASPTAFVEEMLLAWQALVAARAPFTYGIQALEESFRTFMHLLEDGHPIVPATPEPASHTEGSAVPRDPVHETDVLFAAVFAVTVNVTGMTLSVLQMPSLSMPCAT